MRLAEIIAFSNSWIKKLESKKKDVDIKEFKVSINEKFEEFGFFMPSGEKTVFDKFPGIRFADITQLKKVIDRFDDLDMLGNFILEMNYHMFEDNREFTDRDRQWLLYALKSLANIAKRDLKTSSDAQ